MYINTETKELMEKDISKYLGIKTNELYVHIEKAKEEAKKNYCNNDSFEERFFYYIGQFISRLNIDQQLDSMLFFHLSRRLKGTADSIEGLNLLKVLTTKNKFSEFLKKYKLEFMEDEHHIITFYEGKKIDWDNWSGGVNCNIPYIKSRLGYYDKKDFCFNGFAFRDLLERNYYARSLHYCPEIITQLAECIQCKNMVSDYMNNSDYYCYEYKVPIDNVMFLRNENFSNKNKEKKFILHLLGRLMEYSNSYNGIPSSDRYNIFLKIKDENNMPSEMFVKIESFDYHR